MAPASSPSERESAGRRRNRAADVNFAAQDLALAVQRKLLAGAAQYPARGMACLQVQSRKAR